MAAPAERVREFSLEHRARPGLPPFFVTHARDDKTVPVENAEQLAAALKQARVPVELLTPATGGHGFALGRGDESAAWKDPMLHWLDALP
jgi:acetyl esterase/lipase